MRNILEIIETHLLSAKQVQCGMQGETCRLHTHRGIVEGLNILWGGKSEKIFAVLLMLVIVLLSLLFEFCVPQNCA